jgi:hypothetical protein
MTGDPRPGPDEIALSAPARDLCHSLEHFRAGRVRVTFVDLGTRYADDLWPECWHHSYPMCGPCRQATHRAAARLRTALIVGDLTSPPGAAGNGSAP